jgi:hypothetical protein
LAALVDGEVAQSVRARGELASRPAGQPDEHTGAKIEGGEFGDEPSAAVQDVQKDVEVRSVVRTEVATVTAARQRLTPSLVQTADVPQLVIAKNAAGGEYTRSLPRRGSAGGFGDGSVMPPV